MISDQEYVEIEARSPFFAKKYKGQKKDKERMIEYNKNLCKRYPFLTPKNAFSGLVSDGFDYSYTLLDDVPRGWRLAFGLQMVEEIRNALLEAQKNDPNGGYAESVYTTKHDSKVILPYLEGYQPVQIKSKFGELRWYDKGAPRSVYDIISKYEGLSATTCEFCGAPARFISKGWIDPYCENCAQKYAHNPEKFQDEYINIE